MKNAMVGFIFGVLWFLFCGYTAVQSVGACPILHVVHLLSVVIFFLIGVVCFAGSFDRMTEWNETKGFSYPASTPTTEGWEALLSIVLVVVPGVFFTWAGATEKGSNFMFLCGCATLFISCYVFLCRFKPSPA